MWHSSPVEIFGPIQPGEALAIAATALDCGLTLYGVFSGLAREGNMIYGSGKRAAVLAVLLSVVLHFAIRTLLAGSPERGFDPRRETVWAAIATVRGAAAIWNIVELVKVREARRT